MDIDDLYAWKLCRRRLPLDDAFFEDGNMALNAAQTQFISLDTWSEDESASCESFACHVSGCLQRFTSLTSYELHYQSAHTQVCSVCRRVLPSHHLLDLHIEENHDTFFMLAKEKKPSYRCLVMECLEKFSGEAARKQHLVKQHKYPTNFRFNRPPKLKKNKKKKVQILKTENKAEINSDQPGSMDICETNMINDSSSKVTQLKTSNPQKKRVPTTIAFGHGSARAFLPNSVRKKHWHQNPQSTPPTSKIADVDMSDISGALPNT